MTPVSFWFLVLDTRAITPAVSQAVLAAAPPHHEADGLWSWSHMAQSHADQTAGLLHAHGVPSSACAAGLADGLPPLGMPVPVPLGAGLELLWQQGRPMVRRSIHDASPPTPTGAP